jgi:hypothetical protein
MKTHLEMDRHVAGYYVTTTHAIIKEWKFKDTGCVWTVFSPWLICLTTQKRKIVVGG